MKIEKIIDNCNDCQNCVFAESTKGVQNFAICNFDEDDSFLLFNSSTPAFRYKLTIPDNCPLENYTGTQTIKE
jgi:hypothetical protein